MATRTTMRTRMITARPRRARCGDAAGAARCRPAACTESLLGDRRRAPSRPSATPCAAGAALAPGRHSACDLSRARRIPARLPAAGRWVLFSEHAPAEFGLHLHGVAPGERARVRLASPRPGDRLDRHRRRAAARCRCNSMTGCPTCCRAAAQDILRMKGVLSFKGERAPLRLPRRAHDVRRQARARPGAMQSASTAWCSSAASSTATSSRPASSPASPSHERPGRELTRRARLDLAGLPGGCRLVAGRRAAAGGAGRGRARAHRPAAAAPAFARDRPPCRRHAGGGLAARRAAVRELGPGRSRAAVGCAHARVARARAAEREWTRAPGLRAQRQVLARGRGGARAARVRRPGRGVRALRQASRRRDHRDRLAAEDR